MSAVVVLGGVWFGLVIATPAKALPESVVSLTADGLSLGLSGDGYDVAVSGHLTSPALGAVGVPAQEVVVSGDRIDTQKFRTAAPDGLFEGTVHLHDPLPLVEGPPPFVEATALGGQVTSERVALDIRDLATLTRIGDGEVAVEDAGHVMETCTKSPCPVQVPTRHTIDFIAYGHDPRWSEPSCAGAKCSLVMTGDRALTVTFGGPTPPPPPPPPHVATLQVIVDGPTGGRVVLDSPKALTCPPACLTSLEVPTTVVLVASGADSVLFDNWSVTECNTASSCSVAIQRDTTVHARFLPRLTPPPTAPPTDLPPTVAPPPPVTKASCGLPMSCTPSSFTDVLGLDISARSLPTLLALLGLLALIRFPSTLFNSTHLENYVKINDGLRSKIRRVRAPSSRVRLAGVALGALAAAGFELVAEGDFDSKLWPLVGSVVGMALAFLVVSAAFEAPEVLMTTDKGSRHLLDALRVLPGGLVFAGLCAGLSWWLQLNPGYVYGTIAGFVVTSKKRSRRDTEENSGYAAAIASACVGLLTLVAGGLWFLINDWVTATGWMTVPKVAIAIFAATTFAASAQGLVFDYIPLEFLQGENLLHWSRLVWATVFGASLAITISVITAVVTDNGRIDIEWWRVVSAYGALLFFAGLSLRFWNHYRGADPPAEDEPALGESESDTQELVGAKR